LRAPTCRKRKIRRRRRSFFSFLPPPGAFGSFLLNELIFFPHPIRQRQEEGEEKLERRRSANPRKGRRNSDGFTSVQLWQFGFTCGTKVSPKGSPVRPDPLWFCASIPREGTTDRLHFPPCTDRRFACGPTMKDTVNMLTDKIKVAVRVRPFNRRGKKRNPVLKNDLYLEMG